MVEEFTPYIDEAKVRETVNPIMREIATQIYTAASKAGKMVV